MGDHQNETFRMELESLRRWKVEATNQLEVERKAVRDLSERLRIADDSFRAEEEALSKMRESLQYSRAEHQSLYRVIQSLESQLKEAKRDRDLFMAGLARPKQPDGNVTERYSAQVAEQIETNLALNEKISDLERLLRSESQKKEEALRKCSKVEDELNSVHATLQILQEQEEKYRKEMSDLRDSMSKVASSRDQLESDLAAHAQVKKALWEELVEVQKENAKLKQRIAEGAVDEAVAIVSLQQKMISAEKAGMLADRKVIQSAPQTALKSDEAQLV